ncbi:Protein of unknown function [Proteiniborus ethanoligenes]|uniref:Putative Se/S carrier protein-like domain-containing protein n=1 Tax=Proteiniborus ethanoligenes TaxID=415015 RepID=A0A1H3P352_9FIRM|nr:DUF3343 domain-containing protein [Proteiniborus ethanoligenes]SDY95225.1 Protein of unknown function [Proteiniborus ethanoligenes]
MENYYCIVTFHTTNHALNFEKAMKEKDIDVKLMPVPRQVSSSCGTAAQFPCSMKREIVNICGEKHIEIDEIHKIYQKESNSLLSKLFKASK